MYPSIHLSVSIHRRYLDWVAKSCNISEPEQWNDLTREQLEPLPAMKSFLRHFDNSLAKALLQIYPWMKFRTRQTSLSDGGKAR